MNEESAPPLAVQVVNDARIQSWDRLDAEMRKSGRDRDIINGAMGRLTREAAKARNLSAREIWIALLETWAREMVFLNENGHSPDESMFSGFWFYLMEWEDSSDPDDVKHYLEDPEEWAACIEGLAEEEIWKEVRWLCDWIEAGVAKSTFICRRRLKDTVNSDSDVAWLATSLLWANSHRDRREEIKTEELAEFKKAPNMTAIDDPKLLAKIERHFAEGAGLEVAPLSLWLIQAWPLVLHWNWNKGDLCRMLSKIAPRDDYDLFSGNPNLYCLNLGLRGGAARGSTGNNRVKHSPQRIRMSSVISYPVAS